MITRVSKQSQAAISMFTVVILSIFLTVITTGFVRLMVSYQQEAANADLSNRAYYAAQAGFEDSVRQIKNNPSPVDKTDCKPIGANEDHVALVAADSTGIDASYSCQMISLKPTEQVLGGGVGGLGVNKAAFFPITPDASAGVSSATVSITWSTGAADDSRSDSDKSLPTVDSWQVANLGAMLRANIVWGDPSSIDSLKSQAFYFNPTNTADYPRSIDLATPSGGVPDEPIVNVSCSTGTPTECTAQVALNNISGKSIFLVARPIYKNLSTVSVALSSGGTDLSFASGQATIDITGKAGNVYRRIKQNVPYGSQTATILTGGNDVSDFSLVAGNRLCKNIAVGNSRGIYSDSCT